MSGWLTTALEACASERVKKIARQIPRGLCTANERVILVLGYVRSIATNSGLSWGGKHGIQYVK